MAFRIIRQSNLECQRTNCGKRQWKDLFYCHPAGLGLNPVVDSLVGKKDRIADENNETCLFSLTSSKIIYGCN